MATQTSKLTFLIVVLSFQFTSALHRNVCMSSVTVTKDDCRSAATKVCESEANPADPRAETVGNCVATFVNNNNATSPTFTDCMYRMDLILRLTSGASGGGGIHGGASGYDVNNAPTGEALYSILPNDVPGGCLREESLPYDPAGIPVPEGGGAPDPTQDTCSEEYIAPVQSLDGRQRANAWLCWLQGASLTLSLLCPNICYGAYFTLPRPVC
ncbi:MAG: hypothetical protein M1833_002531 [Piccolia ochrophora]|nr:MAG: hypothetical protein M1833_002531 [Piccolia ochrophora]